MALFFYFLCALSVATADVPPNIVPKRQEETKMENREVEIVNMADGSIELWGVALDKWRIPTTFILDEKNELLQLPF